MTRTEIEQEFATQLKLRVSLWMEEYHTTVLNATSLATLIDRCVGFEEKVYEVNFALGAIETNPDTESILSGKPFEVFFAGIEGEMAFKRKEL